MTCKSTESGSMFYHLADHGYIWDVHKTSYWTGSDSILSSDDLTSTDKDVYHILQQLLSRNLYLIVYLANYYSTVQLLGRMCYNLIRQPVE